jgi:hypothetical protein
MPFPVDILRRRQYHPAPGFLLVSSVTFHLCDASPAALRYRTQVAVSGSSAATECNGFDRAARAYFVVLA